jgi:hypothetical protein
MYAAACEHSLLCQHKNVAVRLQKLEENFELLNKLAIAAPTAQQDPQTRAMLEQ